MSLKPDSLRYLSKEPPYLHLHSLPLPRHKASLFICDMRIFGRLRTLARLRPEFLSMTPFLLVLYSDSSLVPERVMFTIQLLVF